MLFTVWDIHITYILSYSKRISENDAHLSEHFRTVYIDYAFVQVNRRYKLEDRNEIIANFLTKWKPHTL